jgi:hypothetical protein
MSLNATVNQSGISQLLSGGTPAVSSFRGNLLSNLHLRSAQPQRGSTPSFFTTLASARPSPSTSQPAVVASATVNNPAQPIRTSPLNQAATSRGATITSSSARNAEVQGLLNTPLGLFNPLQASTYHVLDDGKGNLSKEYFLTACPGEYAKDEQKMARFSELFGLKAAKILEACGTVEGHCVTNYQPTQEQLSLFNDQGNRAWYSVSDLSLILPQNRLALGVDLSAYTQADLLNLYRTDPDFKFYTAGSAPVNTNQVILGRA